MLFLCLFLRAEKIIFHIQSSRFYFLLIRFASGLNCLGLLEAMKCSPQAYGKIFVYSNNDLTAIKLLDEVFSDAKLSPLGSNQRHHENDALCYWRDYVMDVEGKRKLFH